MARGRFLEFSHFATKTFKYRYKCEKCEHITEWYKAKITQGAKSMQNLKRMSNTGILLNAPARDIKVQKQAEKTLDIAVKKINHALASENENVVFQGEPFLAQIFNEAFDEGKKCPHCGARQSWYPAIYRIIQKRIGTGSVKDANFRINRCRPEIAWNETAESEVNVFIEDEPPSESLTELSNLEETLMEGISRNEYDDILLQICDKLIEAKNGNVPQFIKIIAAPKIYVQTDNGLIFDDIIFDGCDEGDSIHAIQIFIQDTAGKYKKQYDKVLYNYDNIQSLEDIKEIIEDKAISPATKRGSFLFFVVLVAVFFRRILKRIIKPLINAIKSLFRSI